MQLSASQLKTFSKCGEKWRMEKIEKQSEPGKKSYGMLNGRILGDAIQACSLTLNSHGLITDEQITDHLIDSYRNHFTKEGIPDDIVVLIQELLIEGINPTVVKELDVSVESINVCSNFEFKQPKSLKTTPKKGYSEDKKRFPWVVLTGYTNLLWFFEERHAHYVEIRDAEELTHEEFFSIPLGDPIRVFDPRTESVIEETIEVTGYFDQRILYKGKHKVGENKTDKTGYTQSFTDGMIQMLTYRLAQGPDASYFLNDLTHQNILTPRMTDKMLDNLKERYRTMAKAIASDIFIPACGTDPYTDAKILCGFKCGGCQYSSGEAA